LLTLHLEVSWVYTSRRD